jgi:hypothetical protein
MRNDAFTGRESLVPDLRGGCISFFPSWPLRSLRRGFFCGVHGSGSCQPEVRMMTGYVSGTSLIIN